MEDQMKQQLAMNGLRYKRSLRRIIDQYCKLEYKDEAIDVDLNNTSADDLVHYMALSKKQLLEIESKSLLDSRDDLLQSHNCSWSSQLDQTQQDGRNETSVSCWTFTDDGDGVSIVRSQQSSLDGSQRNLFETDVLPEDHDEVLEMSLRSQGTTLSELYPSMIERIGRASHRWHISNVADGVLQKYRKWRQQSNRGNHIHSTVRNNRQTTSKKVTENPGSNCTSCQRSPLREQNIQNAMNQTCIPASLKLKSKLNETFTVEEQPSLFGLSPSKSSTSSLGTLSDLPSNSRSLSLSAPRKQPSVFVLSPSRSSHPSSEASSDMLLRSRRLMGEQPSSCFFSTSQSSDASSGVSLDLPLRSRKLFLSVDRNNQQSSCSLSPSRSPGPSLGVSLGLPQRSGGLSFSATTEQPPSWVLSPSRSSGSPPDQSLRSERLSSAAAGEQSSSLVFSPSRSSGPSADLSLRSKRLALSAAQEQTQPSLCVLSPSRSFAPSSDQSLRSKRLSSAAAEVQSSSRSSGDLSLMSKRLELSAAQDQKQPSLCVLSPLRSFGSSTDQSLRSKILSSAAAREQPSSWTLSSLQSSGPTLELSLRSKRLTLFAAGEQQQPSLWVCSPLRPSDPSSDLSLSPKRLFSSASNASESTAFKERPDVDGFPVKQCPLKEGMVNWEGLTRSPQSFSRSPNSANVLDYFRSRASPLRKLLTPQMVDPRSCLRSPAQARNKLWRHLSIDSSKASGCFTYSEKDLDDDYAKQYHKFVCQSELFNGRTCRLCTRSADASRHHSSQSLVALALSPHRFELKKRHRELEWENLSRSKRWSPYSPGSKRHRNETLRRRLCLRDTEAPQGGVFEHSTVQGFNGRPRLEEAIEAHGLPEEYLLGIPGEANMSASN
ncbi:uncharacterized protein si:dkeyp-117h8.4 [Phyllopteryx taeniolatus]|uniref:uncharacterized protein si:dkeyp-117h8.4 n=1 Tax=Phyllopteryx taeniolatus TaxID=161469 RepID=UPI002AD4C5A9|nr:uncharacterized protein si:dkeyp-117h8.4 [Phyllopteryx taeniolatus]XP_061635589.1 uncharacterized protein si:dkeyp-117h8.4 [Phyllopteryx taeniolatus]